MSTKAHIVIEFGSNRIEFYRHWGGDLEITGYDILQKIHDAPEAKERSHFHDAGYLIRLMLNDSDGSLPQYQIVDGLIGHSWEYGYHLKLTEFEESTLNNKAVKWTISIAELEGWECYEDWKEKALKYTLEEFIKLVESATDDAIASNKVFDLDVRRSLFSKLKQKK